MQTNFNQVLNIKDMNSFKWEFMKRVDSRATEKTMSFWLADMDFACSEIILNAVKERADKKILGYARFENDEYLTSVTNWYKREFNWDINKNNIYYSPGLVTALSCIVNILTEKGDGVIIQRPVYPPFTKVIEKSGRVVVNNKLINDNGYYTIDFDDLEEKCKENKVLMFCTPHNPVGRVWTKEELTRVGEICFRNGVYIIADEIHCDLTRTGVKNISLATLFEKEEDKNMIISCTAPSKTFNIAGLAQSHIVINCPDLKVKWEDYANSIGMCTPNPLSLAAAKAAFDGGLPWLLEAKKYIDSNLEFMDDFFKVNLPDVGYFKPEGTYLTWLNFGKYGTSEEIFSLFLDKADLMVQRGTEFGPTEGEGFVRFNAACPRSVLEEGLNRICKAIETVK